MAPDSQGISISAKPKQRVVPLYAIAVFGRVCAGAIFLFAAASKGLDPREIISAFTFVFPSSPHVVTGLVKSLIIVELIVGALLVFGVVKQLATIAALGLLTLFTLWLIYLTIFEIEIGCGCGFPATWLRLGEEREFAIVRNVGIVFALAISSVVENRGRHCDSEETHAALGGGFESS